VRGVEALVAFVLVSPGLASPALAGAAADGYVAARATVGAEPLLEADEGAWAGATAVEWGPAKYSTRFRAMWGDEALFLRFDAVDPEPWHTMTQRDEHLWEEEVVEIFLDPNRSGRDYYELEISPANVVCDVRMVAPSPHKEMDLAWNLAGLVTRVQVRKDASGQTTGWSATAMLPWSGLRALPSARNVALPPHPGDRWRFNLFRIERPGGKAAPEEGAIEAPWSPPGEPSFHVPRAFRDMEFAAAAR
jgi:Carbohydrate family 9 binding domain-like